MVTFETSDAMVQMGDSEREPEVGRQLMQAKQQSRGIRASGYADDHVLSRKKHIVFPDRLTHLYFQRAAFF